MGNVCILIGIIGLYFLNVRFRVNSDSHFAYYSYVFLQFKISFSLIRAYHLMTIINIHIPKLKIYSNIYSVLVSWMFTDVHFLNFGELIMRYTELFRMFGNKYSWCDQKYIQTPHFNGVIIANMYIGNIGLYTWIYGSQRILILSFHILVPCFCSLTFLFSLIRAYPLMTN